MEPGKLEGGRGEQKMSQNAFFMHTQPHYLKGQLLLLPVTLRSTDLRGRGEWEDASWVWHKDILGSRKIIQVTEEFLPNPTQKLQEGRFVISIPSAGITFAFCLCYHRASSCFANVTQACCQSVPQRTCWSSPPVWMHHLLLSLIGFLV